MGNNTDIDLYNYLLRNEKDDYSQINKEALEQKITLSKEAREKVDAYVEKQRDKAMQEKTLSEKIQLKLRDQANYALRKSMIDNMSIRDLVELKEMLEEKLKFIQLKESERSKRNKEDFIKALSYAELEELQKLSEERMGNMKGPNNNKWAALVGKLKRETVQSVAYLNMEASYTPYQKETSTMNIW